MKPILKTKEILKHTRIWLLINYRAENEHRSWDIQITILLYMLNY